MTKRWLAIIGLAVIIGALLFGGVAFAQAAMSGGAQYGPSGIMGNGGVMGGGHMMGNGGMMGGDESSQNPSSVTPVTGNTVTIQNFAYQPANLQVKVGATVTWTNQDTAPHTVTFRDGSLTSSKLLQKGDSYSYTFTKAGTFAYYCQVHPNMTAQVVVTA